MNEQAEVKVAGAPAWTPGPWIATDAHYVRACLHIRPANSYGGELAALYWAPGDCSEKNADGIWRDDPERVANAQLIATAPELYDALAALLDAYTSLSYCDAYCDDKLGPDDVELAARAVLAKARGEVLP